MRLPSGAAFSGVTALWLHGLDVEPCNPVHATAPPAAGISTRAGLQIRRCVLKEHDVVTARGLPATSIFRTLRDLCLASSLTESVTFADMALHARLISAAEISQRVGRSAREYGVPRFRQVLKHMEPKSESPMESRLRMRLVLARLPRPEAQVTIRDGNRFLGRVDLYYREQRLGIEYDGGTHRESLTEDNRRQNRLLEAGVRLLRFTAGDIYNHPDVVARLVRSALVA